MHHVPVRRIRESYPYHGTVWVDLRLPGRIFTRTMHVHDLYFVRVHHNTIHNYTGSPMHRHAESSREPCMCMTCTLHACTTTPYTGLLKNRLLLVHCSSELHKQSTNSCIMYRSAMIALLKKKAASNCFHAPARREVSLNPTRKLANQRSPFHGNSHVTWEKLNYNTG